MDEGSTTDWIGIGIGNGFGFGIEVRIRIRTGRNRSSTQDTRIVPTFPHRAQVPVLHNTPLDIHPYT